MELAAGKSSPFRGSVAGGPKSCAAEALRRGVRNVASVFRPMAKKMAAMTVKNDPGGDSGA